MRDSGRLLWLLTGLVLGAACTAFYVLPGQKAQAANDRYEDYAMCTGAVGVTGRVTMDGVWLLDYKAGKLLGTVIDRLNGKIIAWAEVDLVAEFGIQPRQNPHFMMTTGNVTQGQAALYVAETTTGKFGVYMLGPRQDGQAGFGIRRLDLVPFRGLGKGN